MKLMTFDIWDTCLTRSVAEPRHVFFEVAQRVAGGSSYDDPAVAELAAVRIRAEESARQRAPKRECNFGGIVAVMRERIGDELADAFAEKELEVEARLVRPVEAMRTEVAAARTRGLQLAFLSDMYLPEAFLRQLLIVHGFAEAGDHVYVSGERRKGKPDGAMFRLVQRETGVSPSRWTHMGDKPVADQLAPSRLGIQARRFTGADLTPSERRAWDQSAATVRTGSRLVGGMRAVRLGLPLPAERAGLLANVVAPWLCALAARMVRDAVSQNLSRLYFLSRDGEILLRIAQNIAPPSLECRYLYSSRRAWCFPAMVADDRASRRWLETFAVSPQGILGSLEFTADEIAEILNELQLSRDASRQRAAPEDRTFVWKHLRSTGRMELVLDRAREARKPAVAYLEQEGLLRDRAWAVCDVGWVLNGQAALTRLLRTLDAGALARGLYFMVNRKRPPLAESGPFSAWVLDELLPSGTGTITETLTWLSGLIEEVCFTNADASLRGYRLDERTGRAIPVFDSEKVNPESARHAKELRQAVDRLADEWADGWADELRDPGFVERLCQYSLSELLRFLRQPSKDEARVVAKLCHSSEATNAGENAGTLARPWHFGDALRILGRRARVLSPQSVIEPLWPAGCDALSSRSALALRGIALTPVRRRR